MSQIVLLCQDTKVCKLEILASKWFIKFSQDQINVSYTVHI